MRKVILAAALLTAWCGAALAQGVSGNVPNCRPLGQFVNGPGSCGASTGSGNMLGTGATTSGNLLTSNNTGGTLSTAVDSGIAPSSLATLTGVQTLFGKTLPSPTLSGTVAGSPALSGTWNWGSIALSPSGLTGLPAPVNPSDAVTKSYVDALAGTSTTWHTSVTVASATVLPNTPTYSNGSSGVGATLTAGSNVALVVDGVTVSTTTTRVLVQNQASAFQNGIYTLTQAGSGSVPWILTRAADFNTVGPGGVAIGAAVLATMGTANTGLQFWMNQGSAITIGTTAITWVQIGGTGLTGGTGITVAAGLINLNTTLPSGLTIPSAALTSPTIGGFTLGLGGNTTLPAAPGATACLHMSTGGAITATSTLDCVTGIALGGGLTTTAGTQNTGSMSASAANPNILPQAWPTIYTSGSPHAIASSDNTQIYGANSGAQYEFDLPSASAAGATGTGPCAFDQSGNGLKLTSAAGSFVGAVPSGTTTTLTLPAGSSPYACATSDGSNWDTVVSFGDVPPLFGGTGRAALTAHGLVVGAGTSPVNLLAPVADAVPVWGSASSDPTTAGTSATADSLLGWGAAGSAPAPVALLDCGASNDALAYSVASHGFSCNTITGAPAGVAGNPQYYTGTGFGGEPAVFNVLGYGCHRDGVTDDTTCIQGAINAAVASTDGAGHTICGVVYFPPGYYLIHTQVAIHNTPGCSLVGAAGTISDSAGVYPPKAGANLVTDANATANGMVYIHSDGLNQGGPRIVNLSFGAKSNQNTTVLLNVQNYNHGRIEDSSFQDGSGGVTLGGSADDSNWIITRNYFHNNSTAVECITNSGGCDNQISFNYFSVPFGDVGVLLQAGAAQVGIANNHFDGAGTEIKSAANSASIYSNQFESTGSPTSGPLIEIDDGASNQGRAHRIIGNGFSTDSGNVQATCTASSGSPTLTGCSTTTGIYAGQAACGANLPIEFQYGTNPAGFKSQSIDTLTGSLHVSSVNSGASTVTLDGNASANGSFTVQFMQPIFTWAQTPTYDKVVWGNTYSGWAQQNTPGTYPGCAGGHDGG